MDEDRRLTKNKLHGFYYANICMAGHIVRRPILGTPYGSFAKCEFLVSDLFWVSDCGLRLREDKKQGYERRFPLNMRFSCNII
jgi:hypothetical protein